MASNNIVFEQIVSKYGRLEYKTTFGRNKTLTFKKSMRSGFYFLDLESENTKINIGLDELDELFSMRGQLESLTAFFEKPPQWIHQRQPLKDITEDITEDKENIMPTESQLPPTPFSSPINGMPITFLQNQGSNLHPQPVRFQQIQTRVTKRHPQQTYYEMATPNKMPKFEVVSPAPTFQLTEEEIQEFFQEM